MAEGCWPPALPVVARFCLMTALPPHPRPRCDPKHITKPTGAKPGQVLVRKERVVVGRPAQSAAAASGEAD